MIVEIPSLQKKKGEMNDCNTTLLFGLGNPLLDISVVVDKSYLTKYGLLEDNAILAESQHMAIYDEILHMKPKYLQGGATQNSLMIAQWILGNRGQVAFTGAIQADEFGRRLRDTVEKNGMKALYYYHSGPEPTGVCACLINDHCRSLVTHLAAANHFSANHLDNEEVWQHVESSRVCYVAGYVLTVSPSSILKLARHTATTNKIFAFNLSAPFLCELYFDDMCKVLPYVNILFGNETEAQALAKKFQWETRSVQEIAQRLSQMPRTSEMKNGRYLVVITQGEEPIVTAESGNIKLYPVQRLLREEIVDTNGAGDAFVGGFLAQWVLSQPIDECIRCGIWTSTVVIGQHGCGFPKICEFQ